MFSSLILTATMALLASAAPAPQPQSSAAANAPFRYAPIALQFIGGPASYTLYLNADGQRYNTSIMDNPNLSISQVQTLPSSSVTEAFDPSACIYETQDSAPLTISRDSSSQVTVGPPQPIIAVTCRPQAAQNSCVGTYGACETGGSPVFGNVALPCCPGNICAATRCRAIPT